MRKELHITEGAFAILRSGAIVGPIQRAKAHCDIPSCQVCRWYPWEVAGNTYSDAGRYVHDDKTPRDIIACYPTEAAARVAIRSVPVPTTTPLWSKVLQRLSPIFYETDETGFWFGVYWLRVFMYVALVVGVSFYLFGCAPSNFRPHAFGDERVSDGLHRHPVDSTGKRGDALPSEGY